jgi:ribosomal-protein-alanine N-acetyltransferase
MDVAHLNTFPVLKTTRLTLRELRDDDADAVYALFSHPAVVRFHDLDLFTERAQADAFIVRMRQRFAHRTGIRWAIVRADDRVIGTGGFNRWRPDDRVAYVGYDLAFDAWGQGIMPEALRAMIRFAFERLSVNRIEAETELDNTASMRVLAKCGFQAEGVLRQRYFWKGAFHDMRMFALLRHEYATGEDERAACDDPSCPVNDTVL